MNSNNSFNYQRYKKCWTFEVFVEKTKETGIDKPSKLKLNYPQTIDKERLKEYLGVVDRKVIEKAKGAWKISFDMENW